MNRTTPKREEKRETKEKEKIGSCFSWSKFWEDGFLNTAPARARSDIYLHIKGTANIERHCFTSRVFLLENVHNKLASSSNSGVIGHTIVSATMTRNKVVHILDIFTTRSSVHWRSLADFVRQAPNCQYRIVSAGGLETSHYPCSKDRSAKNKHSD